MTTPQPQTGRTVSVWMRTAGQTSYPPLDYDTDTDVCIVGAGIAGLTVAYLLAREGKNVVVLDDGPIGGGETERTTAHLASVQDDHFVELERVHGSDRVRMVSESHAAAIDCIERIVREEQIACDFKRVDGYLFAPHEDGVVSLEEELEAAKRAGQNAASIVDDIPLNGINRAIKFPNQAQFHPLLYVDGLAKAIVREGGRIFCGSHASEITGGKNALVKTSSGKSVKTKAIVLATNAPVKDNVQIYSKQAPYITYVVGMRVPRGSVPEALYWDTLNPYHYVRLQSLPPDAAEPERQHDILIVGGEDHKTGRANDMEKRWKALEEWARKHFPQATETAFRWSGQVMEPYDGLAFIGKLPGDEDNLYIATGDSGQGMTHGTIAGLLLTDLISGRENPWSDIYDPARIRLKGAAEWLKENMDVAIDYGEWLTGGDVDSAEEIAKDSGAVLREGTTKIAVYRDAKGELHTMSAVCPHKGCIVAWNDGEKTWDCPCHGSRYDCRGTVINGPSIADLKQL